MPSVAYGTFLGQQTPYNALDPKGKVIPGTYIVVATWQNGPLGGNNKVGCEIWIVPPPPGQPKQFNTATNSPVGAAGSQTYSGMLPAGTVIYARIYLEDGLGNVVAGPLKSANYTIK
jgi:hypothetical protein